MAKRVRESGKSVKQRVKLIFLMAYGRPPSENEMKSVQKFYEEVELTYRQEQDPHFALSLICQSIIASAEFRFVN